MRRLVLAIAALVALVPAGAHATPEVLRSSAYFYGGFIIAPSPESGCWVTGAACARFNVNPGERYLHVTADSLLGAQVGNGAVGFLVYTAHGPVHFCTNTASGAVDITGLPPNEEFGPGVTQVAIAVLALDPECGPGVVPLVTRLTAYFSQNAVSLSTAIVATVLAGDDGRYHLNGLAAGVGLEI